MRESFWQHIRALKHCLSHELATIALWPNLDGINKYLALEQPQQHFCLTKREFAYKSHPKESAAMLVPQFQVLQVPWNNS